jgi:serine/threonine protein kinase
MNPGPFGRYALLKRIAQGGLSELWLASPRGQQREGAHVLIKQVIPQVAEDPEHLALFQQEAKISAHLQHPNIARFHEYGEAQGVHYIVREYIHGEPLDEVMRQAQRTPSVLSQAMGLFIGISVCEALHYAHTRVDNLGRPLKLVHREVLPRHILIGFDGWVKLIGFGGSLIATHQNEKRGGGILLAFDSMAPEQASGDNDLEELDLRTDVFCAGLVVYELLTGVRPLRRESNLESLFAARECRIPPPSRVGRSPVELDPLVMKALAREREDRYPSAREFQLALEEGLRHVRGQADSKDLAALMKKLFPQGS